MKKLSTFVLAVICITIVSCRDSKKDKEETEATLQKIESVEKELDQTNKELNNTSKEAEEALNELDN